MAAIRARGIVWEALEQARHAYQSDETPERAAVVQALSNVWSDLMALREEPAVAVAQTGDVIPPYSIDMKRLARAGEGYRGYGWEITARGFSGNAVIEEALALDQRLRSELDERDAAERAAALAAALAEVDTEEGV